MPQATTRDGIRLHYEEVGSGTPILFMHEFAGDHRSWEPQLRHFGRSHRCIAYAARGCPPSQVPASGDDYTFRHFMRDAVDLLDHLDIRRAHLVGLSMGAYTTLQVGLNHPERALSLTLAGIGSGSERERQEEYRKTTQDSAQRFETLGSVEYVKRHGLGPNRVPFAVKDPRGFAEFNETFSRHDAQGSANTMRGFMAERPSLYDFEETLRAMTLPALIIVGDEDDACVKPSLFLKGTIAASGLMMLPKTGHASNLEEPRSFNLALESFLTMAEAGRWLPRDPRSRP